MGYFINDTIAKISKKPQQVSLSGVPNYIEFENRYSKSNDFIDFSIGILFGHYKLSPEEDRKEILTITEIETNEKYILYGTDKKDKVNDNTFFINTTKESIIENFRVCLLKNKFISSNFKLSTLFELDMDNEFSGDIYLHFKSLGTGKQYNFTIDISGYEIFLMPEEHRTSDVSYYQFVFESQNSDTITNGEKDVKIELDVFSNSDLQLGNIFSPQNENHQGTYFTTIQKSYFNQPLWFNLNSTFGNNTSSSNQFLHTEGWCDPGTVKDFRFVASRNNGYEKEPFYISDIFYVIKGYGRNLDNHNLDDYIFDYNKCNIIKPLTNQPILTHAKGQSHFFNFIASKNITNGHSLHLIYRLYTQSGKYIDSLIADELTYRNCKTLNTVKLKIDEAIGDHKNIGKVKVYLTKGSSEASKDDLQVSEELTFHILPQCLHCIKDFAFLNPLGGWSSYGFIDNTAVNLSSSANTIFKTQTPYSTISSEIEAVHTKEVKEQFTVQSMPVSVEVAKWLQEMSTSEAVYELSTKRYIIVDEMKIKYNTNDELVRVEMKYRYSDSYNGLIQ